MTTILERTQELIRTPSISGQESDVQQYIKAYFETEGFSPFSQEGNIILHFSGLDHSKAFIFNSHVDVVDPGDETRWQTGPWDPVIRGDRLYGRGASDMKAGVAASMEIASRLGKREQLPCDVWFTYVVREELDGKGTKDFVQWFVEKGYPSRYQQMAAVFTEPTHLDSAEYGHRGNFFIKALIDGMAGHASRPFEVKPHAILSMSTFIQNLQKEMMDWQERFNGLLFAAPTITPTAITAQSGSPNKVSDHCEAIFDLRTIPDYHAAAYERVQELAKKHGITISLVCDESPPGYTDPSSAIIRALQLIVPDLKLTVSQAAADLGFLTGIGVESVIYGPGEIQQAHQINESIELSQIEAAPELYERLYDQWAQA